MAAKSKSGTLKSKGKSAGAKTKKALKTATASSATKLEARLEELSREIDQVQAQAKKAIAKTQQKYEKILKNLRKKRVAAKRELEQLVNKGDTALHDLKGGVSGVARRFDRAVRRAFRRLR